MNQAKAHIAYKVISFNDYFTFSEFLKKFGETKKAYATENITVTVIDPSQVVGDDLFLQTVMPMGPGGLSLGSPLIPARYLAWQSLPLAFPQPKAPEEVHHDTSTLNKESKETLHTKDKDKKTK
jgi:hypothetical protein